MGAADGRPAAARGVRCPGRQGRLMAKKRSQRTTGGRRRAADAAVPARAAAPTPAARVAAPASHAPPDMNEDGWRWWAATASVAALLAATAVLYDPGSYAPFYADRSAAQVVLALVLTVLVLLPGRTPFRGVRLDLVDALAFAFALWQVIATAVSPAPILAVFGAYNVGRGTLFWLAVVLVFLSVRRLLGGRRFQAALVWIVAVILVVAAVVATIQAFGLTTLWAAWGTEVRINRVPGTAGSMTNLGGLGLLAVWLLAGVGRWRRFGPTWWAVAVGSVAGVVCISLSVTRAAVIGAALCLVLLAVLWVLRRRRGDLVLLGVVVCVAVVTSTVYALGPGDSLFGRLGGEKGRGVYTAEATRVHIWQAGLQGIATRPLFGVGPGGFVMDYRRYGPEQAYPVPFRGASDAHSLPVQLAAGSGVPGLLLAIVFVVLAVRLLWRRRGKTMGEPAGAGVSPGDADDGTAAEAALLAVLAAGCCLVVSPSDAVIVLPAVVIAAAACGPPRTGEGRVWELGGGGSHGVVAVVRAVLLAATCLALAVAVVFGARWWSADRALLVAAKDVTAVAETRRASDLAPWEPWYALKAGRALIGDAQQRRDATALSEGRDYVQRGIAADPTALTGYADLARLDMSMGQPAAAIAELRTATRWNPHIPLLQGLWGYAAFQAQRDLKQPGLARDLADGLVRLPVDTADGWFWLGQALRVMGDAEGASAALAKAQALLPGLDEAAFKARLQ